LIDAFFGRHPGLFDLILGFREGMSKGPTQFSKALDTFGIDRRHMLFVGDSLSDARKALAFGIDFVAISGTLRPESFISIFPAIPVISHLSDIEVILNQGKPISQRVLYT
jgi:phosphoglycolate phosphatase-like HAD superfamily hydrolase